MVAKQLKQGPHHPNSLSFLGRNQRDARCNPLLGKLLPESIPFPREATKGVHVLQLEKLGALLNSFQTRFLLARVNSGR
jgi:hypothetical protein